MISPNRIPEDTDRHSQPFSGQVGMGPREAEELFELFDMDGSGGIDDKEFMKAEGH